MDGWTKKKTQQFSMKFLLCNFHVDIYLIFFFFWRIKQINEILINISLFITENPQFADFKLNELM